MQALSAHRPDMYISTRFASLLGVDEDGQLLDINKKKAHAAPPVGLLLDAAGNRTRLLAGQARGSSAVKFAVIFPMTMLLTIGLVDFGRMMWPANSPDDVVPDGRHDAAARRADSRARYS